jgi:hypothetical protein
LILLVSIVFLQIDAAFFADASNEAIEDRGDFSSEQNIAMHKYGMMNTRANVDAGSTKPRRRAEKR